MVVRRYRATWDEVGFLDADCIAGWGGLTGYQGSVEFKGQVPEKIHVEHDPASDVLHAIYHGDGNHRDSPVRSAVNIERRPCRFGGSRAYFRCPRCGRATLRLAVLPAGLRCGACGRITWASRRETDTQRLVRRANKVAARLGLAHFSETPERPPNMHHVTYMRSLAALVPLKVEIERRVAARLGRASGRPSGWAALMRWGV